MLIVSIFFNANYKALSLYNNIGIDSQLLNILYLNVGQADSTFISLPGLPGLLGLLIGFLLLLSYLY